VTKQYRTPSKYPAVERDISLLVGTATANEAIESTIRATGLPLLRSVELFDIYAGKGVPEGRKSMSYRLTFGSDDRTLEEKDVESMMGSILSQLGVDFGASLRA
jgi:phenylalanyl-tRNA synthetase beta chain